MSGGRVESGGRGLGSAGVGASDPSAATDRAALRASDAERDATISALSDHLAAGRLDLVEFEERAAAAGAARHVGDLAPLLADLPTARADVSRGGSWRDGSSRGGSRWGGSWWGGSRWGGGAGAWAFTSLLCVVIWGATSIAHARPLPFWPIWVIAPWGFVVLGHLRRRPRVR